MSKIAIIIGAGPAGLSAALELLTRSNIKPVVFEMDDCVGGISRTVKYKGNRIDIGPHRFFSKSDRVMNFWLNIFPLQGAPAKDDKILGRSIPLSNSPLAPDPEREDKVFLYRNRITRIFFLKKFFNYPVVLNADTLKNLGVQRTFKIGITYTLTKLWPRKEEKSLEDFFINRFGKELYETFFKDYTEKVWGMSCGEIPADWGAQRIKGLSISKVMIHALKRRFSRRASVSSRKTETSLIESFIYPKLGAGQIYEEMARKIIEMGGEIHLNHKVCGIKTDGKKIIGIQVIREKREQAETFCGDYFFSTMPVKELIKGFDRGVNDEVNTVADGLAYRSHILVGLLLKGVSLKNNTKIQAVHDLVPDNWLYIQDHEVKMGRLFFVNNFSPYMLEDQNLIWLGAEYFCSEGDLLWMKSDREMADFAVDELVSMFIIKKDSVVDYTVVRMPKAYPSYFGTYHRFNLLKTFLNEYENLFLIGRNGMHKYNNMDHSITTAMTAVDNLINGSSDKENIWNINTEDEYHEERN